MGANVRGIFLTQWLDVFFLVLLSWRVEPWNCPPFCFLVYAPIALAQGLNFHLCMGCIPTKWEHRQTHPHPWLAAAPLTTSGYFSTPSSVPATRSIWFSFNPAFPCICNRKSSASFHSFQVPFFLHRDPRNQTDPKTSYRSQKWMCGGSRVNPTCRKYFQNLVRNFLRRRDWACLITNWIISA